MTERKPPHHSRTAPRDWFDLFFARGGWWVIGCAAALLLLTFFAMGVARSADRFDRDGAKVNATVISKRVSRSDDSTTHYVRLSYEVASKTHNGEKTVSSSVYRRSPKGGQVIIRYLKTQPSKFEYPVGKTRGDAQMLRFAALVSGVVGLGLLWWRGTQTNTAVKARRHGQLQLATVTGFKEHENSGTPTGKGYMIWALDNGKRGESLSQDIGPLRRIGVGAKINVYVRDDDSFWEGDVGPRPERPSAFPDVKK